MLTDPQLRRYARNIILPEIGEAGQGRLLKARVLLVGAGGLGSALLSYLAAAGIGHIGLADGDRVELSNLQRQIIHETGDVGRLKVESARDRIEEINPEIRVTAYPFHLVDSPSPDASSRRRPGPQATDSGIGARDPGLRRDDAVERDIDSLLPRYDIVADGCDNFATRFLVAEACERHGKTLVSAAVKGFEGQLSTFKPYLGAQHPRYIDLVPEIPPEAATCTETGVLGAVCGILGSMQAMEVVKEILGIGESLSGTLIRYDGLKQKFSRTILKRG